ncbi:uncharacterized protein LDX57_001546 [Aspergillus melleus]|uniref:uncharacterized protein n=1 Tax=Aspergillus melleus TaxID=138277 RepID=UPI001E8E476D|nr:uncharacterized protein LDX57_001546 [Aspergillus melleus]KAH8423788.1 hypothetical protein LDX57_001546 [Aspergillus melleus]
MADSGKRAMPDSSSNQSSKRRKGGGNWQKGKGAIIESGDCGVFVTCDKGKEGKCIPEAVDLFTQVSSDCFGILMHFSDASGRSECRTVRRWSEGCRLRFRRR